MSANPALFLIGLISTALLSGCVADRPYRLQGVAGGNYDRNYSGQLPPTEEHTALPGRTYRLSFVEFDDQGDFWDRAQLAVAASRVKRASKPVLLVFYIHGWHHNAAGRPPGSKHMPDVYTFQRLLANLAASDSTRGLDVQGVFLGWRGRVAKGSLDYFSFGGRKNAATRAGGTSISETIFELVRQARERSPERSKTIVIGHSFGALVLEKALAQPFVGSLFTQITNNPQRSFRPPVDLILFMNSAAESFYAKQLNDLLANFVEGSRPLLISVTSATDTATSRWYRVGTWLPNLFAGRNYDWGERRGPTSDGVSQREYLTTAPGHNMRLVTHQVIPTGFYSPARVVRPIKIEKDMPQEVNPAFDENIRYPRGMEFATTVRDEPSKLKWWRIQPRAGIRPTPYWIVRVPPEIIAGHSPIFTSEAVAMMAALYSISNPQSEPRHIHRVR